MNLGEIRAAFVKRSGRFDLVVAGATPSEEGADSGADFYINSGQRFLDRLHNVNLLYLGYIRLEAPDLEGNQLTSRPQTIVRLFVRADLP